jgi:hypothetical protein
MIFLSVVELAAATNYEGYHYALGRAWKNCGKKLQETPAKSSLSEARAKISYKFFESIFREDLKSNESKRITYKGFHLYAIDGDQLELPASQEILNHGYRGYPSREQQETHYPKMYTTQVLDICNGSIRDFFYSTEQSEVYHARANALRLEPNSISIYDRLHCGYETFQAHISAENYFIVRARMRETPEKSTKGINGLIEKFCNSNDRERWVDWRAKNGELRKKADAHVRLVKARNSKTKQDYVFITNLPEKIFPAAEIARLYRKRWEIETSFKDVTFTLKLGQWHSKKLNGVLQEIFAMLWLVNSVRRQMGMTVLSWVPNLKNRRYTKTNFKLSVACIVNHLELLVKRKYREFLRIIEYWMLRMNEVRIRDSRSYARVVKHRGREYKQGNMVPRRCR